MDDKVITAKQDLTYLLWSHARNSSGTAGTFLKSQSTIDGRKILLWIDCLLYWGLNIWNIS